jgi:deoxycytidine triphosphate deaminase
MILSHEQIDEAYRASDILIEPFREKQLQAASYDLRVGPQGITTTQKRLVNVREEGYLFLEPGDFGIVLTLEEIKLGPQFAARFALRSRYSRTGLIASTGQIDPGYRGRLIVGVSNLSPKAISLPYGDDFLTVEFHRLEEATKHPYNGPYQGKTELGPEEIRQIVEAESMALPEVVKTLQSLTQNVGAVTGRLDHLSEGFDKLSVAFNGVREMHERSLGRQNNILIAFSLSVLGLMGGALYLLIQLVKH